MNKTNTTKNNNNKKNNEENDESMISKGIDNIGNSLTNIKNQILGNDNKNNSTKIETSKNKTENNKDNNKDNNNKNNKENKKETRVIKVAEPDEDTLWDMLLKIIIMIIVLAFIFYVARYLLNRYNQETTNTPYLLNGSKNAKHALVISPRSLIV